jgi:hypothetical protein
MHGATHAEDPSRTEPAHQLIHIEVTVLDQLIYGPERELGVI